CMQVLQTPHRF
nr:immunoglobulin light chain junction region [Macaca mulatta]MPN86787.1 immunoglobulin light chain junction region [Macaca mulatta]MPN88258.1 immunoglobulin light chain junction region [Macaca mulatta]MPN89294.1 immunoglobulin light chain junction region [Macaca mulatta]MPN89510.1 immunoglobulin light chain junction region [Macaca mulatta]